MIFLYLNCITLQAIINQLESNSMKKIVVLLTAMAFSVHLSAQTNDVAITELIEPSHLCIGTQATIKVKIKNFGTQTQTSIPLSYYGGGIWTPNTETWIGVLAPGDSTTYTFSTLMNVPIGITTLICAYTELVNDINKHNDTLANVLYIWDISDVYSISGSTNITPGTSQTYSINPVLYATGYNWTYTPSNGVTIVNNDTTATITFGVGSSNGVLSVYGYDSYCSGQPASINITFGTGINELEGNNIYLTQNSPNPASDNTSIEYNLSNAGTIKFEVVNLLGQIIFTNTKKVEVGKHSISLNIKDFTDGIYYYSIEYKGKRKFKKMIVAR